MTPLAHDHTAGRTGALLLRATYPLSVTSVPVPEVKGGQHGTGIVSEISNIGEIYLTFSLLDV